MPSPPNWQVISNNTPGTDGLIEIGDPLSAFGQRFYRAVIIAA